MVQRLLGHNLSWRYCQTWVTFVHNLKVFLFSFFVLGAQDSCYKGIEVCYNLSIDIDIRIDRCAILNWMNLLGHRSLYPVVLRGIAQSKIKNCLCVQLQKYQEKLRLRCRKDSKTRAEQIYLDDCSKSWPHQISQKCFPSRDPQPSPSISTCPQYVTFFHV